MTQSTCTTTVKSGRGARHGVVSEVTAFLTVKPGEADELRAGLVRFHERVRRAPWQEVVKIGIVDMRHAVFEDDTRLLWITSFDTDWDPYIDDAVAIIGIENWQDWLRHTVEYSSSPEAFRDAAAVKRSLQAAQVPATGFYRAIPDLTLAQVEKGRRIREAFERVLDDPRAAEALQHPALKPLLDEAAD
ncbi:hypothetical protein OF117_01365 [Geodermatophilus sp. YIM 151500]|uniref:hypothetical protein n=1 Tax=Geodermatophilus sp. YIM 151500 TaxID=2984531 RepID=UPI0021E3C338|nr:hypothetical protein [Geodermatophilus sp. YIM 151500]MCV2487998.1 hypothetical protein [Geodermatophilus sp. YIM 151500]